MSRESRGDKKAESYVRACRSLAGHLVGKGRSVLVLTVTLTQKQTSDSTNLVVRDNSGIGICFGVKTTEGAAASLGGDIREYPSLSPVQLQSDDYIGTCVTTLSTGPEPYTMIRVPKLTQQSARARQSERVKAGVL